MMIFFCFTLFLNKNTFPCNSVGKESDCNAGDLVQSLSQEDPLEEGMTTHSSILAWRIPWTEEPGRLQSMRSQELDMTERLSTHSTHKPYRPKEVNRSLQNVIPKKFQEQDQYQKQNKLKSSQNKSNQVNLSLLRSDPNLRSLTKRTSRQGKGSFGVTLVTFLIQNYLPRAGVQSDFKWQELETLLQDIEIVSSTAYPRFSQVLWFNLTGKSVQLNIEKTEFLGQ